MKLSTKNVLIFTDSQSVLKSLQDCYHESSMIQNILLLHRLIYKITNTSISLKWCPGHKDILGNESADFFAKKSYANFNCSTYFLPFPVSSMKQNVRKINRKKMAVNMGSINKRKNNIRVFTICRTSSFIFEIHSQPQTNPNFNRALLLKLLSVNNWSSFHSSL